MSATSPATADGAIRGAVLRPDKANFVLPGSATLQRELRVELSAQNFLCAYLYVNKVVYACLATTRLEECRMIGDDTRCSLLIGMASFVLTPEERAQVRTVLEPLGLAIEERA